MKLSLKLTGKSIVTMTCRDTNTTITADIADFFGYVDTDFIDQLENIVKKLKLHNKNIKIIPC